MFNVTGAKNNYFDLHFICNNWHRCQTLGQHTTLIGTRANTYNLHFQKHDKNYRKNWSKLVVIIWTWKYNKTTWQIFPSHQNVVTYSGSQVYFDFISLVFRFLFSVLSVLFCMQRESSWRSIRGAYYISIQNWAIYGVQKTKNQNQICHKSR